MIGRGSLAQTQIAKGRWLEWTKGIRPPLYPERKIARGSQGRKKNAVWDISIIILITNAFFS